MIIKWWALIHLHVTFAHPVVIYIGWTHTHTQTSLHKNIDSFQNDVFTDCVQTAKPAAASVTPFLVSLHIPALIYIHI
jgi:hypothetical protein